jgi:ABC-2 type transport system permease protein
MTQRRVLGAYATETKYESLRMLRTPAFACPFLLLPAGLYLLFGALLFGDAVAKDPNMPLFMFMGFAVFGVMGPGMFGFGVSLAMEREQGLLRLKRALPMPPAAPLVAKLLMSALFVLLVMATMVAAAPFGHLKMSPAQMLLVSLVNIAGSLPFCALGLFIGTLASAKSAPAFVNLLYLPMIYLSGILIPMPASVKWIALGSPAYHLEQLALASIWAPHEGVPALHAAFLAAVTLVFSVWAVRRLKRPV